MKLSVLAVSFSAAAQHNPASANPPTPAPRATSPSKAGFSFAVYGDSRSMMYLPYKADQEAEARKLMVDMFALALPEKMADETVQKAVQLTYDPVTHELIQIVMPFDTKSERTTLTLDKGWVTEASVEDTKLLPGVSRTMFRLHGGDWVAREVVNDVRSGRVGSFSTQGTWSGGASRGRRPLTTRIGSWRTKRC